MVRLLDEGVERARNLSTHPGLRQGGRRQREPRRGRLWRGSRPKSSRPWRHRSKPSTDASRSPTCRRCMQAVRVCPDLSEPHRQRPEVSERRRSARDGLRATRPGRLDLLGARQRHRPAQGHPDLRDVQARWRRERRAAGSASPPAAGSSRVTEDGSGPSPPPVAEASLPSRFRAARPSGAALRTGRWSHRLAHCPLDESEAATGDARRSACC